MNHSRGGFVITKHVCLLLFFTIVILSFLRDRHASQRDTCGANLRQLQAAKIEWALEHRKRLDAIPVEADLVGDNNYLPKKLVCPCGGADYFTVVGRVDELPRCTKGCAAGRNL